MEYYEPVSITQNAWAQKGVREGYRITELSEIGRTWGGETNQCLQIGVLLYQSLIIEYAPRGG